jgi:hypothetical protein
MLRISWTRRNAALAVSAVLALLAVAGGQAAAEEDSTPSLRVMKDGMGDMWQMQEHEIGTVYGAAPRQKVDDVLRVRLRHTVSTVTVRMRFHDLARVGSAHRYEIVYRTPDRKRSVELLAGPGHWSAKAYFGDTFDTLPCRDLGHRIDYAANTLTVRVPRRCLGTPPWVRFQIRNFWWGDSVIPTYFDNPHHDGLETYQFTRRVWAP